MRLDGVLSQASSGLDSVQRRLSTIAQNVANADTAGYVRQRVGVESVAADGQGMGVRTGVATRSMDAALQADLFGAAGQSAGGALRQAALSRIDAASGAPGSGQDLAGLVGALRDAFSALASDPANQTQQQHVVNQAGALARGVNGLAASIAGERQGAQDGLVDDVSRANAALRALGTLSDEIRTARARGLGTADLEDRRDAVARDVSELTGAQFLPQPDGDVLAYSGGTLLPLRAGSGPLSVGVATLAAGSAGPPLLVAGQPAALGGRIGAAVALRDTELPGLQAGLDGFAQAVASGFSASGLDLFTDAAGVVPAAAAPGFAGEVRVSAAVQATPRLVRDGAGPAGAAGSTAVIDAVLDGVLAGGAGSVAALASAFVGDQAERVAAGEKALATDKAVQAGLQAKLDAATGVSVDSEMTEMVRLQNSYGANAKVVSAVQAMWSQLLDSVR